MKSKIIIWVIVFFCTPRGYAAWTVYRQVETRSEIGKHIFRFDLDRYSSGVNAWFILRGKYPKEMFANKLPLYQIDENKVHDIQLKEGKYIRTGSFVRWMIYDGKGKISSDLMEFMNGKKVVFQLYLPDGSIQEDTFLLNGVREAVEEVLR